MLFLAVSFDTVAFSIWCSGSVDGFFLSFSFQFKLIYKQPMSLFAVFVVVLMSPSLFLFCSVFISISLPHFLCPILSEREWASECFCVYETLVGIWMIFIIVYSHFSERLNRFCHVQSFVPNSFIWWMCLCACFDHHRSFSAAWANCFFLHSVSVCACVLLKTYFVIIFQFIVYFNEFVCFSSSNPKPTLCNSINIFILFFSFKVYIT